MTRPTKRAPVSKDARIQRLKQVRAADSAKKTKSAYDSIQALVQNGQEVTFTAVARAAQVSTWFLYQKPDFRNAVETAIAQQGHLGVDAAAPAVKRVSTSSLQAELAVARDQIKKLRVERDRYRQTARESLGAALDDAAAGQWSERLVKAHQQVAELKVELVAALDRAAAAEQHRDELMDELTAARASLKKIIRTVPRQ